MFRFATIFLVGLATASAAGAQQTATMATEGNLDIKRVNALSNQVARFCSTFGYTPVGLQDVVSLGRLGDFDANKPANQAFLADLSKTARVASDFNSTGKHLAGMESFLVSSLLNVDQRDENRALFLSKVSLRLEAVSSTCRSFRNKSLEAVGGTYFYAPSMVGSGLIPPSEDLTSKMKAAAAQQYDRLLSEMIAVTK